MAAATSSPSGFSYAQAAKGRSPAVTASQAPATKAAPDATTPASGAFSELTPGGNWADDVEASVGEKLPEAQKAAPESGKSVPAKESAVERAKSEDKVQNSASGVSSPDLTASASTTTKDDDTSSVPTNGSSSETTWETKSQTSEPAWIAERKERQSSSQNSDSTVKGEKKRKESSAPPPQKQPAVMQPAPPPMVNPWMKRADDLKAKQAATPSPPKPATSTPTTDGGALKENQRPRTDSRKKANSVGNVPRIGDAAQNSGGEQRPNGSAHGKRQSDGRTNSLQQGSKPATNGTASTPTRAGIQTRSSLPDVPTAPPPVKDEVSWPTPDTAPEKDRKDVPEKESPEKPVDEATPTAKPKQKWEKIVVTPNIVWETQGVKGLNAPRGAPSGERGGRGGLRGRGGSRGGPNGLSGGDRPHRSNLQQGEEESASTSAQRGRSSTVDRDAMPPPPKPNRAASATSRKESPAEARRDRSTKGQSLTDARPFSKDSKQDQRSSEERKAVSSWVETQSGMPRGTSPSKLDSAKPDAQEEERIPEPIPRRSSIGTQTETNEPGGSAPREAPPPIRMVPSESRKESRSFDSWKEPNTNGATRGAKRGGRGRGGSREFVNGHQANHAYANGDFAGASAFNVPPSPSAFHTPRGNHFTYPTTSRGGWPRGAQRADSVPNGPYSRYAHPYNPSHLQPVPTYVPGMYDYAGYPMSAMPYQPYMDQQYLMSMVSMQLEYYFSIDNLIKDMFLRKNMDGQGFVLLDVVANFNRMKQLTQDRNILKDVCLSSETIQIRVGEDGQERLRRVDGYQQFILPEDQRDPGARNPGPERLHSPEKPQMHSFGAPQARGQTAAFAPSTPGRYDRRSYDSGYTAMNGVPPQYAGFPAVTEAAYGEMTNGDDVRGRAAKSPIRDTNTSVMQQPALDGEKDAEPDAFGDGQIGILTVVVRVKDSAPFHNAATRTFSNGSIDSRSIFGELEKSNETQTPTATNGETQTNGTDGSISRHASPHNGASLDRNGPAPEMQVWWSKNQMEPSGHVPNDGITEPYTQLRLKALDQRNHAATGTCPYDLDVLYQFWSHFLIRNFNSRMYTEFKYYATEDGKSRHNFTGLQALVKYYDQALNSHNPIRDRVIKDYVELVNTEPAKLEGSAFKQLRSAWRNGALNLKNRKKLADIVDEGLKARLDKS